MILVKILASSLVISVVLFLVSLILMIMEEAGRIVDCDMLDFYTDTAKLTGLCAVILSGVVLIIIVIGMIWGC